MNGISPKDQRIKDRSNIIMNQKKEKIHSLIEKINIHFFVDIS
jgi:hypothetical protein